MVRAQYRAHLHNNQDLFQSFENQFAQIEKNISGKPDLYFKMRKIGLNGNKDHFWHFHVQIRITDGRQNLQALRAEKMPQSFSDISMLEYLEVSHSFRQLLDSAANLMEKTTPTAAHDTRTQLYNMLQDTSRCVHVWVNRPDNF